MKERPKVIRRWPNEGAHWIFWRTARDTRGESERNITRVRDTLFFIAALSRQRIGLKSMLGVYVVLIIGMFIAFVTMFAERYWYKKEIKRSIINKIIIRSVVIV